MASKKRVGERREGKYGCRVGIRDKGEPKR